MDASDHYARVASIAGSIMLAIGSAILSGLSLGLMSLDVLQLKVLIEAADVFLAEQSQSNGEILKNVSPMNTSAPTSKIKANWWSLPCVAAFSEFISKKNRKHSKAMKALSKKHRNDVTFKEARRARRIYVIRKDGNLLLVTLLLGNVAVNSAFAIVVESLTSGIVGFLVSTAILTLLGEIIPQAICSRFGLIIGYYFTPLVLLLEAVLFPVAKPVALCLDYALGAEVGTEFNRRQLKALVGHHCTQVKLLEKDEAKIMEGGLEFAMKPVDKAMTPIGSVYGIDIDDKFDFNTLATIVNRGYSRIPVFDRSTDLSISGLLHVKDIILVDPARGMTVRELLPIFGRPVYVVDAKTPLGMLLKDFKKGHTHLAVVQDRIEGEEDNVDANYRHVGVISLEDIIEEILQDEIYDEYEYPKTLTNRRHSSIVSHQLSSGWARRLSQQTRKSLFGALQCIPNSALTPPSREVILQRRIWRGRTSRYNQEQFVGDVNLWKRYCGLCPNTSPSGDGLELESNVLLRCASLTIVPTNIRERLCNANDHLRMLMFDDSRGYEPLSRFEAVVLAIYLSTSSSGPFSNGRVTHTALVDLLQNCPVKQPLPGEKLVRRNRPLNSCYVILRGHVKVKVGDELDSVIGPWNILGLKALRFPPIVLGGQHSFNQRLEALEAAVLSVSPYIPAFDAAACHQNQRHASSPIILEIVFELYVDAVRESLKVNEDPEGVRVDCVSTPSPSKSLCVSV